MIFQRRFKNFSISSIKWRWYLLELHQVGASPMFLIKVIQNGWSKKKKGSPTISVPICLENFKFQLSAPELSCIQITEFKSAVNWCNVQMLVYKFSNHYRLFQLSISREPYIFKRKTKAYEIVSQPLKKTKKKPTKNKKHKTKRNPDFQFQILSWSISNPSRFTEKPWVTF